MSTKTVTLRLPLEYATYLEQQAHGESITAGVINTVKQLQTKDKYGDIAIKGIFTPIEWQYLAQCLCDSAVTLSLRFVPSILVFEIDHAIINGKVTISINERDELIHKIMPLSAFQCEAVYRHVDIAMNGKINLDAWQNY